MAHTLAQNTNSPYTRFVISTETKRLKLMQRVAALNESFNRHTISWNEWSEHVTPILCALNPELHHGAALPPSSRGLEESSASLTDGNLVLAKRA